MKTFPFAHPSSFALSLLALAACGGPSSSDGPSEESTAPLDGLVRPLNVPGASLPASTPGTLEIDPSTPPIWRDHGIFLGHPKGQDRSLWPFDSQAFMPSLGNLTQVAPVLEVKEGVTHVHRTQHSGGADSISDSTNWSGGVLDAVRGAPAAAAGSALEGMTTTSQQHVHYVGTDSHIHELYFTNQWIFSDLTALAGAPAVATSTKLDTYVSPWNNQQHVNFIGTDGHVHELMFDTSWHHTDLTQTTGGGSVAAGSHLDGYASTWNDQQHVNYVGTDGHVHELMYDSSWHLGDLSAAAGATVGAVGTLAGFTSSWNNQQHVNYVGTDGHVHELMYDSSWHHADLTVAANAAAVVGGSALEGYASGWNSQLHINFLDTNSHVRELVYGTSWSSSDLTAASGSPAAARGSALDGYVSSWNDQQHVNFVGADGHVHEMMYDSSWHAGDLTAASGSPPAAPASSLDGYTSGGSQQHVNFLGTDNQVHEMMYDTSWHANDLTSAASLPWVMATGTWHIPTVSQPGEPDGNNGGWDSSSWVGLDGTDGSNDVLQAGVDQFLADDGTPSYVAWYEWFVQNDTSPGYVYQTNVTNIPIHAGDDVVVVIQYLGQTSGAITFTNLTSKQSFPIVLTPPANASFSGNTMEWIMEANTHQGQYASIPAFTPITFTGAYGTDVHGAAGNPASGYTDAILLNGDALTRTTLGKETVTIDFLPWVANDLTSFADSPNAAGAIDGYASAWNSQQHIDYVAADAHVHELMYDTAWHTTDLVAAAGAPAVAAGSRIDGYVSSWNNQQHVNYVGVDAHVHELMYDTSWHHSDLTIAAGGPSAVASSGIVGYVSAWNSQQHVNYVGVDGHVHELMYGSSWRNTDLSDAAGAPEPEPQTPLAGFASPWNNQLHTHFLTSDGHVHELMFDSSWHSNDLTTVTGDDPAGKASGLDGYTSGWNSQQHVNFIDAAGHVHELMFDSSWHHGDLSSTTGAPAAVAAALSGYTSSWNNQQHVNFVDAAGDVHELMYDSSWHHNDLTQDSAGALSAVGSPGTLVGFITPWQSQQHVDYVRTNDHIGELLY